MLEILLSKIFGILKFFFLNLQTFKIPGDLKFLLALEKS